MKQKRSVKQTHFFTFHFTLPVFLFYNKFNYIKNKKNKTFHIQKEDMSLVKY